jgi:hypothetical protein
MADLNVQPKKRTPVWPWILLILIIAAVAYFVLRDKDVITNGTNSDTTISQPADTATQYPADTIMRNRTDTIRADTPQ